LRAGGNKQSAEDTVKDMKPIDKIQFGFSDAENYRRRENRDIFNKIFLRTDALDEICKRNVFFLIREKGTGKTAYAVYLSNSVYKENRSIHKFIRETDYHKFICLRNERKLALSDYVDIWKVILLVLLSESVYQGIGTMEYLSKYKRFKLLHEAIDEYYESAFSPEIPTVLKLVEDETRRAGHSEIWSWRGQSRRRAKDTTQFR
jgi:hypothetical protein